MSKRIGVSPWYWWADVTPAHRETLYVSPERLRVGPPAVKYRSIFINDEMWGIRPWAAKNFAPDEGLGLGPKTYAKIFELLLRLRANYLWPAMHRGTMPFNCYPQNRVIADDYAIVMGSSHIERMLRNNIAGAERDREGGGEWDYQTNATAIRDYWAGRLQANGQYENVYTLGMRGKDDEPMKGGTAVKEKIVLMEQIFADQRNLLARHVNPDPVQVPQVFVPYTEVLGLYDAGLKVPDDVIICWPDDNFGYIRRLPTAAEQSRPGGSGVYYHIQWLNGTTTMGLADPPNLRMQVSINGVNDPCVTCVAGIPAQSIPVGQSFTLNIPANCVQFIKVPLAPFNTPPTGRSPGGPTNPSAKRLSRCDSNSSRPSSTHSGSLTELGSDNKQENTQ